jgi:Zn-dependent M28 family amino/carboxypeptidase
MKTSIIATILISGMGILSSCANASSTENSSKINDEAAAEAVAVSFDADSAYHYVAQQVAFGPRVPNTEAHRRCGKFLEQELARHGAEVTVQEAALKAFDGTILNARNIMGSYNSSATERVLLMAHWDTRPWADNDPDSNNHRTPSDGANDGASGVGVLLEVARQLAASTPSCGVDILFVDAEDWGAHDDDDSWALGAEYFVNNPIKQGYAPSEVILLDMVGGANARFNREYFSQASSPELAQRVWTAADMAGYGKYFPNELGGAITDDHVKFIDKGYQAIDIIEYNPDSETGFNPVWHTLQDNLQNINATTLKAVGTTIMTYLLTR